MIAGTLEIQMLANLARLADDMSKAKSTVGSAMSDIERSVGQAKSILASLGIGLGVGYFVSLVKGSIDAMDALQELGKSTNSTVEELSGLKMASRQSGGDLESVAQSINKLALEMGKHPEKFKALGISAKDPLEAFKQLADVYRALEDPQQRAAVMATALGKSWSGAAPLLAEGSKKIGEMVEVGSRHSAVTTEMARQADELNDKWVLLVGSGGLLTGMIGPILPLLNMLADGMLKAREESKGLADQFSPLLEILKVILVVASDVNFIFTQMGKDMARAFENVQLIITGQWEKSRELGKLFREDAIKTRAELDAWQKMIMEIGKNAPGALERGAGGAMDMGGSGSIFGNSAADRAAAAARAAAFLAEQNALAREREAVGKALQEGMDEEVRLRMETDAILVQIRERALQAERDARLLGLDEGHGFDEAEIAAMRAQYDARNQVLIEGYDREQAAAIAHGEALIQIDEQVIANRRQIQLGFISFLGDLASLMNTQSRRVFEFGKIAAISQAAVSGALAVMDAWKAGMSVGGPWAPAVAAAYATAAALKSINLINNIRSQSFGGAGAGVGGAGGVGGAPTPIGQGGSGIAPPPPQQQPAPQGSIVVNVHVQGSVLDTGEFTDRVIIPAIRDAIDNRDQTIIGPNSRQALDLG